MSQPRNASPSESGASGVYLFCLVAVTLCLAAVMLWGDSALDYRATAIVQTPANHPCLAGVRLGHEGPWAAAAIRQRQFVAGAVAAVDRDESSAEKAALSALERLAVSATAGESHALRLEIVFEDRDRARAVAVSSELAHAYRQRLAREAAHRLTERHAAAHDAKEAALRRRSAATKKMQDLLEGSLLASQTGVPLSYASPMRVTTAAADTSPSSVVLASAEEQATPHGRGAVFARIEQLLRRRDELLLRMTPEHPDVVKLDRDIEQLQKFAPAEAEVAEAAEEQPATAILGDGPGARGQESGVRSQETGVRGQETGDRSQRSEAPRLVAANGDDGSDAPGKEAPGKEAPGEEAPGEEAPETEMTAPDRSRIAARYAEQKRLVAAIDRELSELTANERRLWQRRQLLAEEELTHWQGVRVQSVLVPGRFRRFLLPVALLSLLGGAGAVLLNRAGCATFASVDQAREELATPVVDTSFQGGAARYTRPALCRKAAQSVRLGGEGALLLILLSLAILAVADSDFLAQLGANPLAALPEAWQRLTGPFGG